MLWLEQWVATEKKKKKNSDNVRNLSVWQLSYIPTQQLANIHHNRYFTVTFFYSPDHKNLKEKIDDLALRTNETSHAKKRGQKKSCTMQFLECVFL